MSVTRSSSELLVFLNTILCCILFGLIGSGNAELTPPYFNLAEGRKIYASATCGVGTDGPELYCKLVGANTENDNHLFSVIQGQVCDYCDPTRLDRAHPPEYAIDGTENWWQSPPLSRGMKYNEVNLTIDFGQEFHVAYLFIRMANSPRPGLWTLEKSSDYGKTWKAWQHFSDTPADCETYFGRDSLKPITADDDVICTTEYSKIVPLENGEIPVMLLNNRPSANNYFNSTVLQEWTRATNVRFRFYRTKNLLGHLMSVARQDPTVTRRYFYSIKDISIGGRCMCNGHADTCHVLDPSSPTRILACQCRHNTYGIQCADCRPGYEQKKWSQNTKARPFQCEPCNCHGHSNECVYDENVDLRGESLDIHGNYDGGGVCQHCQHNTEGINCNKCKPTFYRPYGKYWNETDVCRPCNCNYFYSTGNCEEETGRCECRPEFQAPDCQSCSLGHFGYPDCRPCECNLNGTEGYYCESIDGRCPCKPNFAGNYCKVCADGYFGPECTSCNCNRPGSIDDVCDFENGQCKCNSKFDGQQCERCKDGYFNYPECSYCNCDLKGTVGEVCDKNSGKCLCKEGYGGPRCEQCVPGYYNYPDCVPCNCSTLGSVSPFCDVTGKCPCLNSFAGKQCSLCSAGYYSYPDCFACNCGDPGSIGISCNSEGQCLCNNNYDGKTCDQCKEGFYNFPACEECNCDPAGVIAKFSGCGSVPAGELCQCKERVTGRICNECKQLYWNLNITNPDGCEECDCFIDGTLGALETCDSKSGQCACKPSVHGRSCSECKDGSFDLFGGNLFGCKNCACDIGGSINGLCDKNSGQCKCHPRITGRTCTYPITTHYFPTLHQNQFEFEDGYTPNGAHVRYEFDESQFPNFSKRGYAKFSKLQNEVLNEVSIKRSSVYRMVIRYVNPTSDSVTANILITSDNPSEVDQHAKVLFKPTTEPQFVTVSGAKGDIPSPIVLDPGRYTISLKTDKYLFLDYFVLLPAAYYEASILTKKIENPCEIGNLGLCRHYKYPQISTYKPSFDSFITDNIDNPSKPGLFYTDSEHLALVNENNLPLIVDIQPTLNYIVDVPHTGRYIVVVDYLTERSYPETYVVNVNLGAGDSNGGTATLYTCTYTTVCRQPVVDSEGREKIFYIDVNDLKQIEVKGDDPTHVAIKSVTAIPLNEWSIDLITPSPVCVMQDGKCVQATFRAAPDSKKVELEAGNEERIAVNNPKDLYDNATKLIYLDNTDSTVEVRSKVPNPGQYNILVKFYQPNYSKFDIIYKIDADKLSYDGKLNLRNCPSNSGCRELLIQNTGTPIFDVEDNITVTFTNPRQKGVWLDYILIVPVEQFNDYLLREDTFDQTKEFIQKCGQDHFHIQLNATDFCKQAVFSLTSDYNSGALPCLCNDEGSTSFECDPFGGQCQCKADIIGRTCDSCRTGYYGFPNCKPCDCPSTAVCETRTGACICPTHVVGEKCDKCEPYTYGFDQIFGCELCNCNPQGVLYGNLQCDLNNGTCNCLPHIEGRSCDKCTNGNFNFPYCEQCRCSIEGTTFEVCDKNDGNCFCKKNVHGPACDTCIDGTYNLQHSNPDGCTKCFCFGKTTRCERAYLRPFNVSMLKEPTVNTIEILPLGAQITPWPVAPQDILVNDTLLEIDLSSKEANNGLIYFGVLDYLLDQVNHLTSYGGSLSYTLYYTTDIFGKGLIGPDVILEGKNAVIIHQSYSQPASAQTFTGNVKMVESSFTTISGAPVTREQFMVILRDLRAIYIRATYSDSTVVSRLSDVYLIMADEDENNYSSYEELPVEKCRCPPGYTGNSCENCAPGYYRDPNGPYGGYCLPCQCNGHADQCDCNTGICLDCKHSTTGDHCEKCIEGYHGNATFGTPNDCMICACPLPVDGNNFATGCEISEDGNRIHCICKDGYAGELCQSCANGFYGTPSILGETCKLCECSGNINPNDPGSCDSVTGECLKCQNNTFGTACNYCAPGYYGDAIKLKDCQNCICDPIGMDHCDSFIGTCHCRPNVIGTKCDRCEVDHYGFDSGRGCTPCSCAVASNSSQCDDHTGLCRCKPGTTGRQCDRCLPGYWNYTSEGCLPCSCNDDYSRGVGCNVLTGQCECLPGVVGEKCDACPYRWVLIPNTGCRECDICHHALLDVTDALANELDPVINDFKTVANGFFTSQKLTYFNELADKIEPAVKALDPNGVNLTPLTQKIDALELDAKNFERRLRQIGESSKDQTANGAPLLNNSNALLDASRLSHNNIQNTITEIGRLADSFDASESLKVEGALLEANHILDRLNNLNVDTLPAEKQLEKTTSFLLNIEKFNEPVKNQTEKLQALRSKIGEFSDKTEDLYDWSIEANKKSNEAHELHLRNKNATVNSKFNAVINYTKETQDNIENTKLVGKKGEVTLGEIYKDLLTLENANNELKELNDQVDKELPLKAEEQQSLQNIITDALEKQNKLAQSAQNLSIELSNITANSETALKAANAHSDIVGAVDTARNNSIKAQNAATSATILTNGIEIRAGKSDQDSRNMLEDARKSLNTVQADLQPHLNKSAETVDQIQKTNQHSDTQNTIILLALDQIPQDLQTDTWQTARDKAIEAQEKAQEAKRILAPIVGNLQEELNQAKQMPKKVDDTNIDIAHATNQVDSVATLIPNLQTLVSDLKEKQDDTKKVGTDLADRIERLKKQIEFARDIANSIKVGVTFHPNTTLQLSPPSNLPLLAANSKVSAYFKTDQPNGFLLYLGNENKTTGKRNKHNDFLALEVENGFPVLTIDVGNGPEKLISNKNVANGQWHQAVIERNGNDVKLAIREEIDDGTERLHEVDATLAGPQNIFDLDRENTKLFVGGYPPDFNAQNGLKYSSFEGEIEDVKIGDQEVGLWNFLDGQDNYNGAIERDRLIASEIPPTGYRFSGHGYVILDSKPYLFKQRSSIRFKFKTDKDTSDGLLFYAGKHRHFIAIEMRDGGIHFKYKLGQHMVAIGTEKQFNDDIWHRVEAERDGRIGILKVDGKTIMQQETPVGTEENLKITEHMYFGGYPNHHEHTEIVAKNFDGCIDDVHISGTPVDLSRNVKAYGVRPGCSSKFATLLSYPPRQFGYLRKDNVSATNLFTINLKFKTKQPEGLLFYAEDPNQQNTISLALEKGALVLRSQNGDASTFPTIYNDGEWHTVIATYESNKLGLLVDETQKILSYSDVDPLYLYNGRIYFGGLPKDYKTPIDSTGSTAYFVGCIRDVFLNNQLVNFAESTDRKSAVLDSCSRNILDYDPALVPIVYPSGAIDIDIRFGDEEEQRRKEEEEAKRRAEEEKRRLEEERRRQEEEERLKQQTTPLPPIDEEYNTVLPPATTTTTIRPTKKPYNHTEPICKLPIDPDIDVGFEAGYRFGTAGDSRVEYTHIPSKIKRHYEIAFQFKTAEPNGVLFYAASARHRDFIALYLVNGYLLHVFNCGDQIINITSRNQYDINDWQTVVFQRSQNYSKLIVNGEDDTEGKSCEPLVRIGSFEPPYSFGGVHPDALEDLNINLKLEKGRFYTGCIRNIQIGGHAPGQPHQIVGVLPCSEKIESGIFFGKGGGFVKLRERFKVGTEMSIQFEIKPRTRDALLLSVHGKKAMLALQLVNGSITFTVDNGGGPYVAVFTPDNGNFCDGQWHKVNAIKSQYIISLSVDSVNSQPAIGSALIPSTDTTRPLFLGGHPFLGKARNLTSRKPYFGCIRNLKIKNKDEIIKPSMTSGNVQTGVCPLT